MRVGYLMHENRGKSVAVTLNAGSEVKTVQIDMTKKPPLKNSFYSIGTFTMKPGVQCTLTIDSKGSQGTVHVDSVQIIAKSK